MTPDQIQRALSPAQWERLGRYIRRMSVAFERAIERLDAGDVVGMFVAMGRSHSDEDAEVVRDLVQLGEVCGHDPLEWIEACAAFDAGGAS